MWVVWVYWEGAACHRSGADAAKEATFFVFLPTAPKKSTQFLRPTPHSFTVSAGSRYPVRPSRALQGPRDFSQVDYQTPVRRVRQLHDEANSGGIQPAYIRVLYRR